MKPSTQTSLGQLEWEDANVLVKGIKRSVTFEEMGMALDYDPRSELPAVVEYNSIFDFAARIRYRFSPADQDIRAALSLHSMVLDGLAQRDPRIESNRRRIYETAGLKDVPLGRLPWFSKGAMGAVIEGITGTGKSMLVERYLAFLGAQVVTHAADPSLGWLELKQLVWLKIEMPADPHRSGLLLQVVIQMDTLMGTDYLPEFSRRAVSVEKQLVLVLHWLSVHRCGFLIIEENQERNLTAGAFGSEFLMFFLRVLNWGIPTALVGNPKALARVKSFSQDTERFAEGGWFTFWPYSEASDSSWTQDVVSPIWNWSLMPEPDELIPDLAHYLMRCTGGVKRHLAILRRESLREAWLDKCRSVTLKHIERACRSASMAPLRQLTFALVNRSVARLEKLTDIPAEAFQTQWALEDEQKKARDVKVAATMPPNVLVPPDESVQPPSAEPQSPVTTEDAPHSQVTGASKMESHSDVTRPRKPKKSEPQAVELANDNSVPNSKESDKPLKSLAPRATLRGLFSPKSETKTK